MVPEGSSSIETRPQKTEREKKYDTIYKKHVKGKGKFTTQNPLGAPIWKDVKNRDENSEKKKMMTIKI